MCEQKRQLPLTELSLNYLILGNEIETAQHNRRIYPQFVTKSWNTTVCAIESGNFWRMLPHQINSNLTHYT